MANFPPTPPDGGSRGHWSEDSRPTVGPVSGERLERALANGDLDELLRLIDASCDDGDWEVLERIALESRPAHERGHQLWPAADHAEHRLALEAPAAHAAGAVLRDAVTFSIASLTEVAASSHTWEELDAHLGKVASGPLRSMVAHERVARGEDLTGLELFEDPIGLPLRLAPWEPAVVGPTIGAYAIDDPVPAAGQLDGVGPVEPAEAGGPETEPGLAALLELTAAWTEQSNGLRSAVGIRGNAAQAVEALTGTTGRRRSLSSAEALSLLAWAGASGGAHGKRRGMARGRFEAWWCAAALTGLDGNWPPQADQLGAAIGELEWWCFDDGTPPSGWHLQIAVEDPLDGLAWALSAGDSATPAS